MTEAPAQISISFVWFGEAVPAPRMTQSDKWNKRPCVMRYREFKDSLLIKARMAGFAPGYRISHLDALCYLPIPKSSPRSFCGQPHDKKPDLDNLAKSILDGLTDSDQSCWSIGLEKRYDDGQGARLEITIKATRDDRPIKIPARVKGRKIVKYKIV